MKSLVVPVASLLLLSCAGQGPAPIPRVVIITDTHVIGPQYTTPAENSPNDNASILHAPDRLRAIRDRVNAMDPAPEAVFVLGDVVHAAHHSADVDWYEQNENAFTVAREIFEGFHMPVHVLMGNHDYELECDGSGYPRELSQSLFQRFFGAAPYYAVEYGGVRFHLLNGQQGRTWDVNSPDCDTYYASFGGEQLAWLDASLALGKPSVVMSHYMGLLWAHQENPGVPAQADLETVMNAHPNAGLYLGGHTHRWLDFSNLYSHQHYVVGPSRYDSDNFWVLELGGPKADVFIRDREKAIWGNTCARTYTYDGDHDPVEDASVTEEGDCVSGVE